MKLLLKNVLIADRQKQLVSTIHKNKGIIEASGLAADRRYTVEIRGGLVVCDSMKLRTESQLFLFMGSWKISFLFCCFKKNKNSLQDFLLRSTCCHASTI